MRVSIEVPSLGTFVSHLQIKSLMKDQVRELFHERLVPVVLRGMCKVLEVVANNTADAHDYLISKIENKQ